MHAHLAVVLAGDVGRLLPGELLRPLPLEVDTERLLADADGDELLRLELAADLFLFDQRARVVLDPGEARPGLGDELADRVRGGRGVGRGRRGRRRGRRGLRQADAREREQAG